MENIIKTMTGQHRTLQKDLGGALDLTKSENPSFGDISGSLKQFGADLMEHLHLENDTFYPELLAKMKNKGVDVSKTEDFISQMENIGVAVMAFLEKYKDASLIERGFEDFKKEIEGIISALNLRVESEESGVYGYWKSYE